MRFALFSVLYALPLLASAPAPRGDSVDTSTSTAATADPVSPGQAALPAENDPAGDDTQWTVGHGRGVSLWAKDGSFRFDARARVQLRAGAVLDPDGVDADQRLAAEFMVRRARLVFGGMVLHDMFRWGVQLGMSQNDVELDRPIIVRDAWVQWNAPAGIAVRLGQMKVPFDRQRQSSSSALQFADRTRMVSELTLDRDIGVQVFHNRLLDERLLLQAGVFGGDGRNRPTPGSGVLVAARAQVMPLGPFDDLVEGDIDRKDAPRLAIAAAVAHNTRSTRALSTTGVVFPIDGSAGLIDYGHGTVDVLFKWAGLSLFAAGLARVGTTDHGAPTPIARSAVGVVGQAGYMITDGLEVVGRATWLEPVDVGLTDNAASLRREWEASGGANFFFWGHDLKLQTDMGAFGTDGRAVRGFARAQLQLFF